MSLLPASLYRHDPVLAEEVYAYLVQPETKGFYDGTLGLGGHAKYVLGRENAIQMYVGVDLDVRHAEEATKRVNDDRLVVHVGNFSELESVVEHHIVPRPMSVLLDLGICSAQIDDAERGFSFVGDGPLDMAFSHTETVKANEWLAEVKEAELVRVLKSYGELGYAKACARGILEARDEGRLATTKDLADAVRAVTPVHKQKRTLTQVFQAIRIAVNDELGHLEKVLDAFARVAEPKDRLGVISYHSLEDRLVKRAMKAWATPKTVATEKSLHTPVGPAKGLLVTKKAVVPTAAEVEANPRARSAKWRCFEWTHPV